MTRAFERFEARLRTDSTLLLFITASDARNPLGDFDPRTLSRLDDSTALRFGSLLRRSLARADDARCGAFLSGTIEGFVRLLEAVDSSTVDEWLSLAEYMVYAQAYEWPLQPLASSAELEEVMLSLVAKLSERERQRVATLQESASTADYCWFLRRFLAFLPGLPAARAARVFRGLMAAGADAK